MKIDEQKYLKRNFSIPREFSLLLLIVILSSTLLINTTTNVKAINLPNTIFATEDQNDAGSGGDAGDSFENATDITFGVFLGELPAGDFNDFYKFFLGASVTLVTVEIAGTVTSNLDLYLYNAAHQLLRGEISEDAIEEFTTNLVSGWYVIQVNKVFGNTTYYLTLTDSGTDPITDPETPTDTNWQETSPGTTQNFEWLTWLIPGVLVIAIIIAITIFVRTRNRTVYTKNDRRNKALRIQGTELQKLEEERTLDSNQGYTFKFQDKKD